MVQANQVESLEIVVRGIVQGVGFRPYVYSLATGLGLAGCVYNTSGDVRIEVEGTRNTLDQFLAELGENAPPLAHIEEMTSSFHPPLGRMRFEILPSATRDNQYQLISPDTATCRDCLNEVFDPNDRRYRYPFTNCTNCGPRFTIIEDMPYDRHDTTMRSFEMCPECQQEYEDPADRRFHAQPNACPVCGPHLTLLDASGREVACHDVIEKVADLLEDGNIIALKGLGGFLLACDAASAAAVQELRRRKQRPFKPFAVMVPTMEEAEKHCVITEQEKTLLLSQQSPIVLLPWKSDSSICREVAPFNRYLGVMLPYTPLHHILLLNTGRPLVMTSGNITEEPIAKDNEEALDRLSKIADYFVTHDRDIYSSYDDSVTYISDRSPQIIRRARGYAPHPVRLPFTSRPILGCGAEDKNTFCLGRDNYAFLSQHIGDLKNAETLDHFTQTVDLYRSLFRISPDTIAHDLHPDYLSTHYAQEMSENNNVKLAPVQHHHAHIASCMVDNGITSPVIGIAFDGTGYGTDGCIWGGEFLVADLAGFQRLGHIRYLQLPGGDAAIKKPYRTAIGYISSMFGDNILDKNPAFLTDIDRVEIDTIVKQINSNINAPLTSSMGRLFDAVSALVGVRKTIDYDGQAAIELEMAAFDYNDRVDMESYPYSIVTENGIDTIQVKETFSAIIDDLFAGCETGRISVKFHNTVVAMTLEMCQRIGKHTGITDVALSGGVFQNRLLLNKIMTVLLDNGFSVYMHRNVPCNDGGISLGQVAVANFS